MDHCLKMGKYEHETANHNTHKGFKDKRCQNVNLFLATKIYKAITNNSALNVFLFHFCRHTI